MTNVKIRTGVEADFKRCLTMDAAFETDYVWQMDNRVQNRQIDIAFHTVRLPRSMVVPYPRDQQQLTAAWQSCDAMYVAEDATGNLLGYVVLAKRISPSAAWVSDLVVARQARRQGVGSALLTHAVRWAREEKLIWLLVEVQTKNYPAICFCQKQGLAFCGFQDRYYPNQDIAVFLSKAVH